MSRPTYDVEAIRKGNWWMLAAPDVPGAVTQVRNLRQADEYMREAIAFVLDVAPDSFDLTVTPMLPARVVAEVRTARKVTRELVELQANAAVVSRKAVKDLSAAGLTGADTATVLGISPQRVSQLAKVSRTPYLRESAKSR